MDYTPKSTEQPPAPVAYELKTDVSGKSPEKRGPMVIEDRRGNKIRVPFAPKPKCKICYGRGFIGTNITTGEIRVCHSCYRKT